MIGLNDWLKLLERSETAVLSGLMQELDRITDSDESSGVELAEVVLKDSSLTSKLIKVANSAHFNPGGIPVTTVSRAIINIGFKNIRSVCVSLKLLEALLKETPSPMLVATLAKTLHAATQAKVLCDHLSPPEQEEVYVASMMSHLAELLVLSSSEESARSFILEVDAETDDGKKDKLAEKTLGVSISRLARSLMKRWRIEGVVREVLTPTQHPSQTVQAVRLADEISRAAIIGWDSPEFKDVLKRVAKFKGLPESKVRKSIINTADEAADAVKHFDNALLDGYIPTIKNPKVRKAKDSAEGKGAVLLPNENMQLKLLQELTSELTGNFDINTVFKLALLGMNEGVGLERVTLAIFDRTHQKLQTKYAKGEGTKQWKEAFVLRYVKSRTGFLYNLFEKDRAAWIGNSKYRQVSQYVTGEYKGITGVDTFFIVPLMAKGKRVGVIYADMGVSNRELSDTYFAGFCHFAQQVKFALTLLSAR